MSTIWAVDEDEILRRLDSMEPEAAAADAAEIGRIIADARRIATGLEAAFAGGGGVRGVAATEAENAGRRLAARIGAAASRLNSGMAALQGASTVLAATVSHRPAVELARANRDDDDAKAESITRAIIAARLTGTYNGPMSQTALPETVDVQSSSGRGPGADIVDTMPDNTAIGTAPGDAPAALRGAPSSNEPGTTAHTPDRRVDRPTADTAEPNVSAANSASDVDARTAPDPASPAPGHESTRGTRGVENPSPSDIVPVPGVLGTGPGRSAVSATTAPRGAGPAATGLRTLAPTANPALTSAGASTAASGAGSGGGGPRQGPGPYGAGPAARRSNDDTEHRPAAYLRSSTEGLLLLGPQPVVGPAVIGQVAAPAHEGSADPDGGVDHREDGGTPHRDDDQEVDPTL